VTKSSAALDDQKERTVPDRLRLEPGPNHPITIRADHQRVVVTVAGGVTADIEADGDRA
jgi:hypothetical protein